eukprot:46197_1
MMALTILSLIFITSDAGCIPTNVCTTADYYGEAINTAEQYTCKNDELYRESWSGSYCDGTATGSYQTTNSKVSCEDDCYDYVYYRQYIGQYVYVDFLQPLGCDEGVFTSYYSTETSYYCTCTDDAVTVTSYYTMDCSGDQVNKLEYKNNDVNVYYCGGAYKNSIKFLMTIIIIIYIIVL